MAVLEVQQIPMWDDDYGYPTHDPEGVVDRADAEPVLGAAAADLAPRLAGR